MYPNNPMASLPVTFGGSESAITRPPRHTSRATLNLRRTRLFLDTGTYQYELRVQIDL